MGKEVGIRARAKESEKSETRRDDDPPLASNWSPFAGHDARGCKNSEHRRRGSHCVVMSAVDDGGESIAASTRE